MPGDRMTLWAGEQDTLGTSALPAELTGLHRNNVTVHGLPAGGSFGRRVPPSAGYLDPVVALARAVSPRLVKLILHPGEDFTQGAYRPALATRIAAALGPDGLPLVWDQRFLAAPTRNMAFAIPYGIPGQTLISVPFSTHLRTGTWRAVAHTQHTFWTESFIDELAHAAGQDPCAYRRVLLAAQPRWQRVLDHAAGRLAGGSPCPRSRAAASPLPRLMARLPRRWSR
ncbi:MAG: molybdopterin cofactor-binding domain-containing protein [Paracoccaceae bacterium]